MPMSVMCKRTVFFKKHADDSFGMLVVPPNHPVRNTGRNVTDADGVAEGEVCDVYCEKDQRWYKCERAKVGTVSITLRFTSPFVRLKCGIESIINKLTTDNLMACDMAVFEETTTHVFETPAAVVKCENTKPKFEVGDVVRLKCGSPRMVVSLVDQERIRCEWVSDGGEPQCENYDRAIIHHIQP